MPKPYSVDLRAVVFFVLILIIVVIIGELAHLDGRWSGAPCWRRPTDGIKFALARQ